MFNVFESSVDVKKAEENEGWRAFMARTYDALAENIEPVVKELEIKQLVPKEVSGFTTPAFRGFLGTLERFELSYFFNYLRNITEFSFTAYSGCPIGLQGHDHSRLALNASQMRLLKCVYLESIFVCPEMVEFLVGHVGTLERISFQDCYGGTDKSAYNQIQWSALFAAAFEKFRHF
ncbi:hypothetical protein BZG36_03529 [Bifiguratus adelaidae]|uniref:Uncharacterized protein n=1 Tax=Bifiguratus adelaidae TaxID=1938954 RepID=A0A261XZ88_9FUNG|nr:hypothetical protein BZG36_03529 [Bifiguratus adelaidae]